jgi:magnesium-transporting ATPase (P-type)
MLFLFVVSRFSERSASPAVSPNNAVVRDTEIASFLKDHLSLNATVSVSWEANGKAIVSGSKTEGAGVLLVESMGYRVNDLRGEAGSSRIVRQYPFTAERKMMSTLVALDPSNPTNGPVRLFVTGVCLLLLALVLWSEHCCSSA